MPVTDCTDFVRHAVIVVNTDVAASQRVANYFCNMYGISRGNQVKLALGTTIQRAYAANQLLNIYKPIADKIDAIGGQSVLCAAGCPMGIDTAGPSFWGPPSEDNPPQPLNFPLLAGMAKRIVADGYDPSYMTGVGNRPACGGQNEGVVELEATAGSVAKYAVIPASGQAAFNYKPYLFDRAALATMLYRDYDARLDAAVGSHLPENWKHVYSVTRYRSAPRDFSKLNNLPTGVIGYPSDSLDGANHPGDLYNRSVAILEKSISNEGRLEQQLNQPVLIMLSGMGSYSVDRDAWVALVMKNMGFTNVTYWYDDAWQGDTYANAMLPPAQGINSTGIGDWNLANLDGTTTNPASVSYKFGYGTGFINNKETAWGGKVVARPAGGFITCGASHGALWGKKALLDSGFSAVWHPGTYMYNWHQTGGEQGKTMDVQMGLVRDGLTLTEAAFLGMEMSMLAVGNPLMRPFK